MKALANLWGLRRRSDKVKAALWLFVLSIYCFAAGAWSWAGVAHDATAPAEYVLESPSAGAGLKAKLQAIREMEGVVWAAQQGGYTITWGGKELAVTVLPPEYLTTCYGLAADSESRRIWLNPAAFESFIGQGEPSPTQASYQVETGTETGTFVLCEQLPGSGSLAVAKGDSRSLGGSAMVRVMLKRADISGTSIKQMEDLGFLVTQREQLLLEGCQRELVIAKGFYRLAAGALAGLAGWALYRLGKGEASPL